MSDLAQRISGIEASDRQRRLRKWAVSLVVRDRAAWDLAEVCAMAERLCEYVRSGVPPYSGGIPSAELPHAMAREAQKLAELVRAAVPQNSTKGP